MRDKYGECVLEDLEAGKNDDLKPNGTSQDISNPQDIRNSQDISNDNTQNNPQNNSQNISNPQNDEDGNEENGEPATGRTPETLDARKTEEVATGVKLENSTETQSRVDLAPKWLLH
jgi:hypothetical protein